LKPQVVGDYRNMAKTITAQDRTLT